MITPHKDEQIKLDNQNKRIEQITQYIALAIAVISVFGFFIKILFF